MVRIQRRDVATATGLSDSEAYAELAGLVTAGLARWSKVGSPAS
jgi:hypothetical protein